MSSSDYTTTPNLGLFKPTVDADNDMWGDHLNANADTLDAALATSGGTGRFLPLTGGTMTGPLNYTATGGTVARAAQDRAADRANALDFGADPSGSLDSAPAINAAAQINMPHAGNKSVYLPAGKYYIRSAITLPAGVTLFGDGRENTIISAGQDFDPAAAGIIILTGREAGSSAVRDLRIDMTAPLDQLTTASAATAAGGTTITLASVANVNVNDYVFDNTTAGAVPWYTVVNSIAGNVITISAPLTGAGVANGDTLAFSPSRARFKTLAAGGTAGLGGNSGIMYPPVINANGSNRFEIINVWITSAWDGIVQNSSATANGGGYLHNVSISAFNNGLWFDNLVDYLQISDFRFGGFTISNVHAGQRGGVFMDGQTNAATFGRIDGMAMTNSVVWIGRLNWLASAVNSQDPHVVTSMVMDSGTIQIANVSTLLFAGLTMVGGAFGMSETVPLISINLGRVQLSAGSYVVQNSELAPAIAFTGGGAITVGGGSYIDNEGLTQPAVSVPSGTFSMNGGSLIRHGSTNTTAPLVQQSGTGGVILKNVTFGGGTGTPVGVAFGTDTAGNAVANLALGIYTVTLPANTALGNYGQSIPINATAGNQRDVTFQTNARRRFVVRTSGAPETGGNAGSNFNIDAYADDGSTLIGTPIAITRASGLVALAKGATVTGGLVTDTITATNNGSVFGASAGGNINVDIIGAAATGRALRFMSGTLPCFILTASGGNNVVLSTYDDTGALLFSPITIARLTGVVSMIKGVAVTSGMTADQVNVGTVAGPNIRSGTGAATGTQPKGSLWMRTDGAVGSTMYVSQGGGTWNAVGGV